jgi:hypothetical protein
MADMCDLEAIETLLPSLVLTHRNRRYAEAMDTFDVAVDMLIQQRRPNPR